MRALRSFEVEVVRLLAADALSPEQLGSVLSFEGPARYEYSGSGYFVTLSHPALPQARVVCYRPIVIGRSGAVACGFVVYIEHGELTLECHTWGPVDVPDGFREFEVELETAA